MHHCISRRESIIAPLGEIPSLHGEVIQVAKCPFVNVWKSGQVFYYKFIQGKL